MSESNAMPIPARPREGEPPSYEQFCRYIYDTAMGAPAWHVYEDRNYASARQAWLEQRVQELEAALRSAISRIKGREWTADLDAVLSKGSSKGAQPKEEA